MMTRREFCIAILMYTVTMLFLFYEMAIQVSPSIMTHQLMRDFHMDSSILGIMAASYFYSYALMQIPAGLLYDRFGPRTLLTAASFCCALGCLFFGETTSLFWASAGRFLMGLGSSFAFIGVLVVAARWFDKIYFVILVGTAQFFATLGAVAGQIPLAKAVDLIGWRMTTRWLTGIGLTLTLICFFVLRDRPEHEHQKIHTGDRSLRKHLGQILKEKQTWCIALYAFSGWAPVAVFAGLWGVPFLMARFDISNYVAAIGATMSLIGAGVFAPFVGMVSDRIGLRKPVLYVGSIIGAISAIWVIYGEWVPFWLLFVLLFFMGVGSSVHILTFGLMRDRHHSSVVATAVGFNNMAVVIGGALFQPLVGYLLAKHFEGTSFLHGVPLYTVSDFRLSLFIVPALYLFGLLISVFAIEETYCHTT